MNFKIALVTLVTCFVAFGAQGAKGKKASRSAIAECKKEMPGASKGAFKKCVRSKSKK